MGTRPARPGDVAIIIRDENPQVCNIGKQVEVVGQCCVPEDWHCLAHEPMTRPYDPHGRACRPGDKICLRKKDLIAKEDPDDESKHEELKRTNPLYDKITS